MPHLCLHDVPREKSGGLRGLRASPWTAPRSRLALLPLLVAIAGLLVPSNLDAHGIVINEILGAPPPGLPEFVEVYNSSTHPFSLAGARLSGSVAHDFGASVSIGAHDYLVLTPDREAFLEAYGFSADGGYSGSLRNEFLSGVVDLTLERGGRHLTKALLHLTLDARLQAGSSLELRSSHLDPSTESSWDISRTAGGTPGGRNSTTEHLDVATVVPRRGVWKYHKGLTPPLGGPVDWTSETFDDSTWESGAAPLGYGNQDDATTLEDMRDTYSTVYARYEFTLRDTSMLRDAVLWIVYDDGFVAYLNGIEVARRNLGEPGKDVGHDAVATDRQRQEGVPEEISLGDPRGLLRPGTNVLALHGANEHVRSSDFSLHASLSVTTAGSPPHEGLPVLFNEAGWAEGAAFVELFHVGGKGADLSGVVVARAGTSEVIRIDSPPAVLLPGGFLSVPVPREFVSGILSLRRARVGLEGREDEILTAARFPPARDGTSSGRFPDGASRLRPLPASTPGRPNAPPVPGAIVITEIHYHPLDPEEEFVELVSRGATDLGGFQLWGGVRFAFPPRTRVEAGEHVVVARNREVLLAKRPELSRALGPFQGRLANDADTIVLLDPSGREVDFVHYADDGSWPADADGEGVSVELISPEAENESGYAWRAALRIGGSPGMPNSVARESAPPIVESVTQDPVIPGPGDSVTIRAHIAPEHAYAELLWRTDGDEEFTHIPMAREGTAVSASVPPQPAGKIIEYTIRAMTTARDGPGGSAEVRYPPGEPGTALFQFENRGDPPLERTYRLIFRARDRDLLNADVTSNELRPVTFVGLGRAYHDARARFRGNGSRFVEPRSFRVRFTDDNPFPEGTTVFLNGFRPQRQVMGMDLWRRAGMPYSRARIVRLKVNGQFIAHYAQVEPLDEDYLVRHFGENAERGNLYRGLRAADLTYLGADPVRYRQLYEKRTNEEAADWSDVMGLTRVFSETTDEEFALEVERWIDVEEWIRWFCVNEILSNQEGGLHRDTGDDYFLYRPPGGRFVLLPWDMDSTFLEPRQPIFRPSLPAIRRLLTHPRFAPVYYQAMLEILEQHFSPSEVLRQAAVLGPAPSDASADPFVAFARERNAEIRHAIPTTLTVDVREGGFSAGGLLHATANRLVLRGLAPATETRRVIVNGVAADFVPWKASWSAEVELYSRHNLLDVSAYDADGREIATREVPVVRLDDGHVVSTIPSGLTLWSEDRSPFILTGRTVVGATARLGIEKGSVVVLPEGASVEVRGELRTMGTADDPVVFAGQAIRTSRPALQFVSGASGELSHTVFVGDEGDPSPERLDAPLIRVTESQLDVRRCRFDHLRGVMLEVTDGVLDVEESTFRHTGEAIHGVRSTVLARANLIDSVRGDADGIDLDGDAPGGTRQSRLELNTVLGGDDDGIDLLDSSAMVTGNRVEACGDRGISVEGDGQPVLAGNIISRCADGIALKNGTAALGEHNTISFSRNGLVVYGKRPYSQGAQGALHSTIVWGNERDIFVDGVSSLELTHSNVGQEPGRWGEENFALDPLFAGEDDFRLSPDSPCIGRGRNGSDVGAMGRLDPREPEVTAIDPPAGPVSGGITVTVSGSGLQALREARFGGRALDRALCLADGTIRGTLPPAGRAGAVEVVVRTAYGEARLPSGFAYTQDIYRGDANGDLQVDLSDAVAIIEALMLGSVLPVCLAVADVDGDEELKLEDALFLLRMLYLGEQEPDPFTVDC